ncbi:hypothetical protein H5410_060943 [Solanum commersonii]|uniref:Uncharacterized protein n=1 Tax=Solanum commersonii TaxID=4109 RepID=A0A9J5W6T4_SOLCO|nr:hypothetical protein H5410_060943 [Solanum commersonii]
MSISISTTLLLLPSTHPSLSCFMRREQKALPAERILPRKTRHRIIAGFAEGVRNKVIDMDIDMIARENVGMLDIVFSTTTF